MPIFIGHSHLLDNFLDVFVCRLYCPVHLRPVGRGVVVLDFKVLAHFPHHLVVPIGGIVRDNLSQQFVLADYLLFNKPMTLISLFFTPFFLQFFFFFFPFHNHFSNIK